MVLWCCLKSFLSLSNKIHQHELEIFHLSYYFFDNKTRKAQSCCIEYAVRKLLNIWFWWKYKENNLSICFSKGNTEFMLTTLQGYLIEESSFMLSLAKDGKYFQILKWSLSNSLATNRGLTTFSDCFFKILTHLDDIVCWPLCCTDSETFYLRFSSS